MCGIVGLFLKDKALEPSLGHLMAEILATICDRGPDSAGFAVYGPGKEGITKITLQSADPALFRGLADRLAKEIGAPVSMSTKDTHAVLRVESTLAGRVRAILARAVRQAARRARYARPRTGGSRDGRRGRGRGGDRSRVQIVGGERRSARWRRPRPPGAARVP